ncbi:hypothetical protein A2U01_0073369, partial [Trifolium medium]|nr:hypothetical protein [Trifolium medium]
MAEPPSPPPSMASPDHDYDATGATNNGVLRPPPLRSLRENDSDSRSDLSFTLCITEKLNETNFHLWRQQVEPY